MYLCFVCDSVFIELQYPTIDGRAATVDHKVHAKRGPHLTVCRFCSGQQSSTRKAGNNSNIYCFTGLAKRALFQHDRLAIGRFDADGFQRWGSLDPTQWQPVYALANPLFHRRLVALSPGKLDISEAHRFGNVVHHSLRKEPGNYSGLVGRCDEV